MANMNQTIADKVVDAQGSGQEAKFLHNGVVYEFSPTGLASYLSTINTTGVNVSITLTASATTDGMDVAVQVIDGAGAAVAAVNTLEVWVSDAATGIGLTSNDADAEITVVTGAILTVQTAEKHWSVVTDATGLFSFILVDADNPETLYIAAKKPNGTGVVVSAISGENWEGIE